MNRAVAAANKNQRAAADPANSAFVTANAGSGKTKVLVDRIARLLLEGSKPSAFLCITYTKAAAAEMQRRLFERLGGWCVADDAKLAAELKDLGAETSDLGRARALFAQALETPGGLKIQTIHAFCERLLARFPLEAGVAPGFDIADESRAAALLGQARAYTALGADAPQEAFKRFAARMSGDMLDAFLDRLALRRADFHRFAQKHRGAVFAEAELRNRHGARQTAEAFRRAFMAQHDWKGLHEAAGALASGSAQDQETAERLRAVLDCVESHPSPPGEGVSLRAPEADGWGGNTQFGESGAAAPPVAKQASRHPPLAGRDAPADAFAKCFAFAFTGGGKGDLYKKYVTATTQKAHPWLEPALRRFAESCVEARETINAIDRADDAVASLQLALMLDRAYEAAKDRAGALDFDDLIEHAHALLVRSDAAPWVLYKLDGGLDHILIDEGQDTSPTQWDLITPLQDEFFAGAGARAKARTMFAVGDPKQSIYGFQGADPRRFLSEAQSLSKRAARAKQKFVGPVLETSFRSTPEVLRAVDAVFAEPGRELIAAPGKHDEIRHLASREEQGGAVEVWPLAMRPVPASATPWDAPLDVETGATVHAMLAKQIATRVRAMIDAREAVWDKGALRPMRAGDVLALVRTRGAMFRELIKAFKRVGLPVAGADRMILRDELAVEDCLALMRVALDPADDLALACVLKGPWCNLDDDDADIFPLAYGRERETLFARLMASTEPKYAFARSLMQELTARAGADPFAFLSWALETAHEGAATGWERVLGRLGDEARDPLEELLQRALKPSPQEAPTLQRFLYEIEVDVGQVKRELEAQTGALRVMTVHGAKGLEAPVVILPDTTGEANDKPDDNLIFDDEEGPFVAFRMREDDKRTGEARAAHQARMLGEHWRLLYVAMTRARDRLIVCGAQFGSSANGEAEESWRAAVQGALTKLEAKPIETPYGEGLRYGDVLHADASATTEQTKTALPAWAKTQAPGAVRLEFAAPSRMSHVDALLFSPRGDGQKRFRRGRMIHGLLERLPDVAPARQREAALAWLARQGVASDEAAAFAAEALKVIADARFASVFGPNSRAEAPIIGEVAGRAVRGVVDRLSVESNKIVVLDFKTDRPAPQKAENAPTAYMLQLALYREVLRQIFPGKAVSCALLWTEEPRLMELPDPLLDAALRQVLPG